MEWDSPIKLHDESFFFLNWNTPKTVFLTEGKCLSLKVEFVYSFFLSKKKILKKIIK